MNYEDFEITWGEFKKKLEEQGIKDETKIAYIDMHGDWNPKIHFHIDGSCNVTDGESRDPLDKE
jgi:hypothetical protein